MSRGTMDEAAPTMIIPRGTRIEMDPDGQISIHAPGNVVVQNSGKYGTLESLGGSIRIDRGVEVEASTIRCAQTCFVQGFLTAWKVSARSLHLEDGARAHVVLQETQRLEIGRDARLVGNFSSENELLGLFSRFANQVRTLPFFFEKRNAPAELPKSLDDTIIVQAKPGPPPPAPPPPEAAFAELPEPLLFALVLLERESEASVHPAASQKAIDQLHKLLEQQDLETLQATHRTLFGRIAEPREDAQRARELVAEYFASPT
ncbi:MAG TPA: hypothetical protein VE078_14130 [Thermoanaerobaculia bacterium]|nr:hypothetical protein [Thermoanaerobaculia bacterium]